jgi:hybrid cluster-associated redox disulfide protein
LDRQFTATMTVDSALALHPAARWVFAAYRIGGCDSCSAAADETLAEVASGYRLDLQHLLTDLNSLLKPVASR